MNATIAKLLLRVGLVTLERTEAAEKRADDAEAYSRIVTAKAAESGDLIVAGDCTRVDGLEIEGTRRLIVAPGATNTFISNVVFLSDKS